MNSERSAPASTACAFCGHEQGDHVQGHGCVVRTTENYDPECECITYVAPKPKQAADASTREGEGVIATRVTESGADPSSDIPSGVERNHGIVSGSSVEQREGQTHYEGCWRHHGHHACAIEVAEMNAAMLAVAESKLAGCKPVEPSAPVDWTEGEDGRSNSSEKYEAIVEEVRKLLTNLYLGCDLYSSARLIVSQLAHVHGLGPSAGIQQSTKQEANDG